MLPFTVLLSSSLSALLIVLKILSTPRRNPFLINSLHTPKIGRSASSSKQSSFPLFKKTGGYIPLATPKTPAPPSPRYTFALPITVRTHARSQRL
jgi:hypothetical protein